MTVMLGSNPNLLLKREGRIVGRVQKFAKFPNPNGFREFESHPSRHDVYGNRLGS